MERKERKHPQSQGEQNKRWLKHAKFTEGVKRAVKKSRICTNRANLQAMTYTAALCITAINYYYFCSTAQQSLTFSVKIIIISIQSGSVFVALANLASGMGVAFRQIRELNNYVTLV